MRALAALLAVLVVTLAGCTPVDIPTGANLGAAYDANPSADALILDGSGTYSGGTFDNSGKNTLVACQGAKVNGLSVTGGDVLFSDCDFDGIVYLDGADTVGFLRSDFGPRHNGAPLYLQGRSDNVTVQDSTFHDATASGDAHTECMYVGGAYQLTVTGSDFRRCTYIDIFLTDCCPAGSQGQMSRVLIEDNTLCKPTTGPLGPGYYSVQTHPILSWSDSNISHNRIGAPILNQAASSTNVTTSPNDAVSC